MPRRRDLDEDQYDQERDYEPRGRRGERVLAEATGKSVVIMWQGMAPSGWGSTTLELTPTRVVERTRFMVAERESELFLSEVEAVEYVVSGNPLYLILGIPTIVIGVGLVLLIMYFFLKHRFVVIWTSGYRQAVAVRGDSGPYLDFMDAVLAQVEKVKRGASGGSAAAAAAPAAAAAAQFAAAGTVRCRECGSEYRLPPGSEGKRFRCQKCQATIDVPAEM